MMLTDKGLVFKTVTVPYLYESSLKNLPAGWRKNGNSTMEACYYGSWLDVEIGVYADELSGLGIPKAEISGAFEFREMFGEGAWACRFDVEAGEAIDYAESVRAWRPNLIPYPFIVEDHEGVA